MVPPVMVTSLTVLTPPLLVTPIMWDISTVKVTTAVSPALMVVLSSVMVAMGAFLSMGCGLRWCAEFRQEGCGHGAFLLTQWVQDLGWVSFAARGQGHGGVSDVRCPPGGGATACIGDNVETNPAARNIASAQPITPVCRSRFAQTRHHGPGVENHGQHAAGGGFCAGPDGARCSPACRRPPGGGRPGPGRGWPRTGHSIPEASVHFAGVACRISVLSRHRSSVGLRWPSKRIAALHRLPIQIGMGCALRLALRSDGCAQPTTSDR